MTGFTTGETLKAWSWFNDGWSLEAIKTRLNAARRTGYLKAQNLQLVTISQVEALFAHLGIAS